MEAEGFRRVTYFPDRPDVMSRYTATLIADQGEFPVLLSNGNLLESAPLPEGRHYAVWHDPYPKPCYLFALAAGELSVIEDFYTTRSGRRVSLRIYVEKGDESKTDYAMRALQQAFRWDEETFGLEYDLDIFIGRNESNATYRSNKEILLASSIDSH
jgi:aminopeptidase N